MVEIGFQMMGACRELTGNLLVPRLINVINDAHVCHIARRDVTPAKVCGQRLRVEMVTGLLQ